jgi:hypothetical protein
MLNLPQDKVNITLQEFHLFPIIRILSHNIFWTSVGLKNLESLLTNSLGDLKFPYLQIMLSQIFQGKRVVIVWLESFL